MYQFNNEDRYMLSELKLKIGRINTFLNTEYHRDIGTYESLNRATSDFIIE